MSLIIHMTHVCFLVSCTTLDIPKWGLLRGGHFWGQLGLAFVGGRTLDSSHHWFSWRPAPWTVQVRSISIGTCKTRGIRLHSSLLQSRWYTISKAHQIFTISPRGRVDVWMTLWCSLKLRFLRLVGLGLWHLHHHRHCNRFMVKILVKVCILSAVQALTTSC